MTKLGRKVIAGLLSVSLLANTAVFSVAANAQNAAAINAGSSVNTPSVSFSFDDAVYPNVLRGTTEEMEFSLDGGVTYYNCTNNTDLSARLSEINAQKDILVRYKATGTESAGSPITIDITAGSSIAGVSKTDCTTTANNDGSITGVTSAMEYKRSGDSQWIRINGGTIYNLQSGTYEVRNRATGTTLAGTASQFNIRSYSNGVYIVKVNGSYDMTTGEGTYRENETVSIYAGNRSNYRFIGWTTSDGVYFQNSNSANTSFTMPAKSVTVTAQWQYVGEDGYYEDDYYDDYYSTNNPPTVTPAATNDFSTPTTVQINIASRVDRDGYATVTISDGQVQNAINKAREGARKNGVEDNGYIMVMNINTNGEMAKSMVATIPRAVQSKLVNAKIKSTVINLEQPDVTMGFDFTAVKEIYNQADATVYLTAQRISNQRMSDEVKNITENRPVYEFKLTYGNNHMIRTLDKGKITMSIPYPLQSNESAENIQAVVVESTSRIQRQCNSSYINNSHRFVTNKFATYSTCTREVPYFTDTESHWARDDIANVASRGLFGGTSDGIFSPDISMTRGMFVTALGRLANVDVSGYRTSSFYDVKPYSYYVGYIEWAVKSGIVNGVGLGRFAPDSYITREQMALIMSNYIKYIDFTLPKVQNSDNVFMFADNQKIGFWAKDSVKIMNTAGIISGKNDNMFDPQGTTTRAEAAAVLKRLMDMMIESDMKLFQIANVN